MGGGSKKNASIRVASMHALQAIANGPDGVLAVFRYGFPRVRKWRFKTGTSMEFVVVALTCILVVAGVYFQKLFV